MNGVGSKIIPKLQNIENIKLIHLAITETFPPVGTREELLKRYKLDNDSIKEVLLNLIGKKIKA